MPPTKAKKRKQLRREEQKRFGKLRRRLARGPCRDMDIQIEPRGRPKMSEVLLEFVEPYADYADTKDDWHRLLTLATLAWNAALLPAERRQAMIDEAIAVGAPGATAGEKADLKDIVTTLIARKKACFGEYTQMIVDFQLQDTDEGIHLSVASTFTKE